jgi:hypothetical protein
MIKIALGTFSNVQSKRRLSIVDDEQTVTVKSTNKSISITATKKLKQTIVMIIFFLRRSMTSEKDS